MDVIIGVPIHECKSYAFKKFIENQTAIKKATDSNTSILFCTEEPDFANELETQLKDSSLEYRVVMFQIDPELDYQINNITRARECIRQEFLQSDAQFLAFIDSDLTFDVNVLNILIAKLKSCDIVYNSYLVHNDTVCNNGLGTCLIKRNVLEKIGIRCSIYQNPYSYIDEGYYFEMDSLHTGFRIEQGAFVTSCHYSSNGVVHRQDPRRKNRWEKTVHSRFARRTLSLFINIPQLMKATARFRILLKVY